MPDIKVGEWVRVLNPRGSGYLYSRVYEVDDEFVTLDASPPNVFLKRYMRAGVEPVANYCPHCGRHDA